MLTRDEIVKALLDALEPLDYVHAMWQGGSAAFGRNDEWSDIDVQFIVDDERVEDGINIVEEVLKNLSPVELRYEVPQPTWHGHTQVFYRLKDTSPFLMADLCVMKLSSQNRFLEPEVHGNAVVYFDKSGAITWPEFQAEALIEQLKKRLETMRVLFDLFQVLTLKEIRRGMALDAFMYYQGYTLRPLVEALRMKHDPARYNFHARYLYYDLPKEIVQRLEPLFFVTDLQELEGKFIEAQQFFWETVETLNFEEVAATLEAKSKV
jgi:hypothetical protein